MRTALTDGPPLSKHEKRWSRFPLRYRESSSALSHRSIKLTWMKEGSYGSQ